MGHNTVSDACLWLWYTRGQVSRITKFCDLWWVWWYFLWFVTRSALFFVIHNHKLRYGTAPFSCNRSAILLVILKCKLRYEFSWSFKPYRETVPGSTWILGSKGWPVGLIIGLLLKRSFVHPLPVIGWQPPCTSSRDTQWAHDMCCSLVEITCWGKYQYIFHRGQNLYNAQGLAWWQHPVASSEARDLLHQAMHPASYCRIRMVIKITSKVCIYISSSILLLSTT